MKYQPDQLLGTKGISGEFISIEEERAYLQALKTQPDDWIYRERIVTYDFNSLGHRCKEITELKDDYFLVVGCSYTMGYGLKLEDTYPYLLSQKLNLDYYNLSINGSGPDLVFINTLIYLNKYKKPKFVLIQWPDISRMFLLSNEKKHEFKVEMCSPSNKTIFDNEYHNLLKQNIPMHHNIAYRNVLLQFLLARNIRTYEFFLYGWLEGKTETPRYNNFVTNNSIILPLNGIQTVDKARDLHHPGIKTNYTYYKTIIDYMD